MQQTTQLPLSPHGQNSDQPQHTLDLQDKAEVLHPPPQHRPPVPKESTPQQPAPDKMTSLHAPYLRHVVESQAFKNILVDEMDMMLSQAATLIQASWRGYQLRQKLTSQMVAAKSIQEAWRRFHTRRLLRSTRTVVKKVNMEEGDIPYHPPQQVRFQPLEEGRPLLAQPVTASKETQFPSAATLANCTSQMALPQPWVTPQLSMQTPCAVRGPTITFVPHPAITIRLSGPETKCLLTRTVRSTCLDHHVEEDIIKTKQITTKANKAGASGPPLSGKYMQIVHGTPKAHVETEVKVLPQKGPAPVISKTLPQPSTVPTVTMTKASLQTYPVTKILPQPCPVTMITLTKPSPQPHPATPTKASPQTHSPATMAKTPFQSTATKTKTPPQTCPPSTTTKTPFQACLTAMMNRIPTIPCPVPEKPITKTPPQTHPLPTTVKVPFQPCATAPKAKMPAQTQPTASVTNTSTQTQPAATVTKIPPQICLLASMIKHPPQTHPAAVMIKTPAQTRPVTGMAKTPVQTRPVTGMAKTPAQSRHTSTLTKPAAQTCRTVTGAKIPPQTPPRPSFTKAPPQARLAAMITKTPGPLRSVATILRTLCMPPPAGRNMKTPPAAAAAAPNTSFHTCPNGPKGKSMVNARHMTGMTRISSHSCLIDTKVKYCPPPQLGPGASKTPAKPPLEVEKIKASPQKQVKTGSNTCVATDMTRVSPWVKVTEGRKSPSQAQLSTDVVEVEESQVFTPIETTGILPQAPGAPRPAKTQSQAQLATYPTTAFPQKHPLAELTKVLSQGQPSTKLATALAQSPLGACLAKVHSQAHMAPKLAEGSSLAHLGTCLTKAQSQAYLPTMLTAAQSQAHLPTPLTKAQSQAQLITETAKCLYVAQQTAELSSKTQSQPLLAGSEASTQPCQHVSALGPLPQVKLDGRRTQLPAHNYVQAKAAQGPQVPETQSMQGSPLTSTGHPSCKVESWGDSRMAQAQSSTANRVTPGQEELVASQLASLCAELVAILGSQEDLRTLLAKALSQGEVRTALGQALSKEVLTTTRTKAVPQSMLSVALVKALSWGDMGIALARALSRGELQGKLTDVINKVLSEEERTALSQALSQGELGAVLGQPLSQAALRTGVRLPKAASRSGSGVTMTPTPVEADHRGNQSALWGPTLSPGRSQPSKVRVPQDGAWEGCIQPTGLLAEMGDGVMLVGSPCWSVVPVGTSIRSRVITSIHQCPLMTALGPTSSWGRRSHTNSLNLFLSFEVSEENVDLPLAVSKLARDLRPQLPPSPYLLPLPSPWQPLTANGVGPSTSQPSVASGLEPRSHKQHTVSRVTQHPPVSSGECRGAPGKLPGTLGNDRPAHTHQCAAAYGGACWCQPSSACRTSVTKGPQQPSMVPKGTMQSIHPPSHKRACVSFREMNNKTTPSQPQAMEVSKGALTQLWDSTTCDESSTSSDHPWALSGQSDLNLFPALAGGRLVPTLCWAAAPSQGRNQMQAPIPGTTCPQGQVSGHMLSELSLPQGSESNLTGSCSRGSKACGPKVSAAQSAVQNRSSLSPSTRSAARLTGAGRLTEKSWEADLDRGLRLDSLVASHALGIALSHALSQGERRGKLVDVQEPGEVEEAERGGHSAVNPTLYHQSFPVSELIPSLTHNLVSSGVNASVQWDSAGQDDLDRGSSPSSVSWNKSFPLAPGKTGLRRSLSLGDLNPTMYPQLSVTNRLTTSPYQPVTGKVDLILDQPHVDIKVTPSLPDSSMSSKRTPCVGLSSKTSGVALSLNQVSGVSGVPPNGSQTVKTCEVDSGPAQPSVISGLTPSLAQPSVTDEVASSPVQLSMTGGVASSLAQPSVTYGVVPCLSQLFVTRGVAPSLAQPSVTSGVTPNQAQPLVTGGMDPHLVQPSMASGLAPSLGHPFRFSGVMPSVVQPSMANRIVSSLAQTSKTSGVGPHLRSPSMVCGVTPRLAKSPVASGGSPRLICPSVATKLTSRTSKPSVISSLGRALSQPRAAPQVGSDLSSRVSSARHPHPPLRVGVSSSRPAARSVDRGLSQPSMSTGVNTRNSPLLVHGVTSNVQAPESSKLSLEFHQPLIFKRHANITDHSTVTVSAPNFCQAPAASRKESCLGQEHGVSQGVLFRGLAANRSSGTTTGGMLRSMSRGTAMSGMAFSGSQGPMFPGMTRDVCQKNVGTGMGQSQVTGGLASIAPQASVAGVPLIPEQVSEMCSRFPWALVPDEIRHSPSRFPLAGMCPSMSQVIGDPPVHADRQDPPVSTTVTSNHQQPSAVSQDPVLSTANDLVSGSAASKMTIATDPGTMASGMAPSCSPRSVIKCMGQIVPPGSMIGDVTSCLLPDYIVGSEAQTLSPGTVINGTGQHFRSESVTGDIGQGLPRGSVIDDINQYLPPGSLVGALVQGLVSGSEVDSIGQGLPPRPLVSGIAQSIHPGAAVGDMARNLPPAPMLSRMDQSIPSNSVASAKVPVSMSGGLNQGLDLGPMAPANRSMNQSLPQGSMMIGIIPHPYLGLLAGEGTGTPFQASHNTGLAHPQTLETSGTTKGMNQASRVLQSTGQPDQMFRMMPFETTDGQAVVKPGDQDDLFQAHGSSMETKRSVILEGTPWMHPNPMAAYLHYSPENLAEDGTLPLGPRPLLEEVVPTQAQPMPCALAPDPRQSPGFAKRSKAGSCSPRSVIKCMGQIVPPGSMIGDVTSCLLPDYIVGSEAQTLSPGTVINGTGQHFRSGSVTGDIGQGLPRGSVIGDTHSLQQRPATIWGVPSSHSVSTSTVPSVQRDYIKDTRGPSVNQQTPAVPVMPQGPSGHQKGLVDPVMSMTSVVPRSPTSHQQVPVPPLACQGPSVPRQVSVAHIGPWSNFHRMIDSTVVSEPSKLIHDSSAAPGIHPKSVSGLKTPSYSQRLRATKLASHMPSYPSTASGAALGGLQTEAIPYAPQKSVSGGLTPSSHEFVGSGKSYTLIHGGLIPDTRDSSAAKTMSLHQVGEDASGSPMVCSKRSAGALPGILPILHTEETAHSPAASRLPGGVRKVCLGYVSTPNGSRRSLLNQESLLESVDSKVSVDRPMASLIPTVLQGPTDVGMAGGQAWNSTVPTVAVGPMSGTMAPGDAWAPAGGGMPWETAGSEAAVDPRQSEELVASVQSVETIVTQAVITIQACTRGYLVRRTIRVWHQWAIVIQAAWRGYCVRRDLIRLTKAATVIQATWRGFYCRHSQAKRSLRANAWVDMARPARATSDHRCFQSCQPHVCTLCRSLSSGLGNPPSVVMLMGSSPRTCHMCGQTLPTRVVHGVGQGSGQVWDDSSRAASQRSQQPHDQNKAAVTIQNKAAVTIQAAWRGFLARRRLRQQQQAAKMLQATWRGHRTRSSLSTDALLGSAAWAKPQHMQWLGV